MSPEVSPRRRGGAEKSFCVTEGGMLWSLRNCSQPFVPLRLDLGLEVGAALLEEGAEALGGVGSLVGLGEAAALDGQALGQ